MEKKILMIPLSVGNVIVLTRPVKIVNNHFPKNALVELILKII